MRSSGSIYLKERYRPSGKLLPPTLAKLFFLLYFIKGVEIKYEMYDPTLHKVEVLKLEKRLDDELLYLRDALNEYSTFDVNMDAEILAEGDLVHFF